MVIHRRITESANGCVDFMVDHCGGDVNTPPTEELPAEVQVRVLVIEEITIVEETNLLKHFAAVKRSRCTSAKNTLLLYIVKLVFPQSPLKTNGRGSQTVSGA